MEMHYSITTMASSLHYRSY